MKANFCRGWGWRGAQEEGWSVFPDSPGCGEPRSEASVCIYYSQPAISSAGPSFLRLFLPPALGPRSQRAQAGSQAFQRGSARPPAFSLPLRGESKSNMSAVLGVGKCVVISLLQDRGLKVAAGSQIYSTGGPRAALLEEDSWWSNSGQAITGKKA